MCQMGTVPKQQQMVDSSCLVSYHTQTDALICWICSTSWFSSLKLSEYSPMLKTFYYWILLIKSLIEFINFPEGILIRQYRICKYAKTFFSCHSLRVSSTTLPRLLFLLFNISSVSDHSDLILVSFPFLIVMIIEKEKLLKTN